MTKEHSKAKAIARQSSWDPVWEKIFSEREWGKYPSEHVIRFVARNWYKATNRQSIKLLEIGCGPGANAWYMAREGFSVSAIDGSPKAVSLLEERLAAEGLRAEAVVGDFIHLPWQENTFDGVIDNAALNSNRSQARRQAIDEIRRVLKPGGLFFSANFTNRCWGYGLGGEIEPGGFVEIPEGPFEGKGFTLMMNREQVDGLYKSFSQVNVESTSTTLDGMKHVIEMWLVTCAK